MIYTSDYVGKWYWLKYDDKILLVENMSSELERATNAQKLIQGDSGTHVISNNGKKIDENNYASSNDFFYNFRFNVSSYIWI